MTDRTTLDVDFCRAFFPPIGNGLAYLENAGGSYVPEPVIEAVTGYMRESQCQPGWTFASSRQARARIDAGLAFAAGAINAGQDEVVVGPSTTLNAYVLAQALRPAMREGDEIIVTNQDHESNGGVWRRLAQTGITVREWRIDPTSGDLDLADLDALLGPRTRLVCFPHVSNIVGSANDVAAITARAHAAGARVCVDGVAAVAHDLPDVKALDVDFYLFSFYKLYGPHLALLYAKREHIVAAANQNHYFHEHSIPAKLNPGGLSYESVAGIAGIGSYLEAVDGHHFDAPANSLRSRIERVYTLFRAQEANLMARLLGHLDRHPEVRLVGRRSADPKLRAPTFCLVAPGRSPEALANALAERGICVGHGHFYGKRCVEALGIDSETGVLRLSMVHYNTVDEIDRAGEALHALL